MSTVTFRKVRDFHAPRPMAHRVKRRLSASERQAFDAHGYWCHYCGAEHSLTTDHIIARANGGTDAPSNLIPACHSCNASKGTKSYEDFCEWLEAETAAFAASYQPGL